MMMMMMDDDEETGTKLERKSWDWNC